MKVKIFSGQSPSELEKEINNWLVSEDVKIRIERTETAVAMGLSSNDTPEQTVVISVWYWPL